MKDTKTTAVADQEVVPARRLMRVKGGAEYIAVSPRTFWTLLNTGQIPSIRFGAGTRKSVRVDRNDLDAWIEEHKGDRR